MMHLTKRAASRLPRPRIGQAFTATTSTAVRHSSNISADEFVEQSIGTQQKPHKRHNGTKKTSSIKIRKVAQPLFKKMTANDDPLIKFRRVGSGEFDKPPSMAEQARPVLLAETPPVEVGKDEGAQSHFIITKHDNRHRDDTISWKLPAEKWPEKPLSVISSPRALNLRRLPLATTTKDIVLSISNVCHEHRVDLRSTPVEDIVIRSRSDTSEEVDAVVDFRHPDGAQSLHRLAVQGKFKVQGVVPEVSLEAPKGPFQIPQPSEDKIIAQLSKQDRREYFESHELRKVVRRTPLVYN